jgi:carbonic anhydrase
MVEFSRRANSAVLVLRAPTMVSRRPGRIWAASARVRARSSTSPAHSGSRDDLSHGCHIRSEQCHHDAHVGPLLQRRCRLSSWKTSNEERPCSSSVVRVWGAVCVLARGPVKLAKSCETAVHRATAFPGTRLGHERREGPGCLDARATFRHFYLVDARLDPAKFAGLAGCDAHVIRNAGGRASDDAIGHELQTSWHTGVLRHPPHRLRYELADHPGPAAVHAWTMSHTSAITPLVPKSIPVHGYIYDVAHGKLTEVEGVRAGGASA